MVKEFLYYKRIILSLLFIAFTPFHSIAIQMNLLPPKVAELQEVLLKQIREKILKHENYIKEINGKVQNLKEKKSGKSLSEQKSIDDDI